MTLDIELFREEKGGDPDKMRENQKKRFKDIQLVETVIEQDKLWRQLRHQADGYNRLRNQISKAIGEKMKKKEEPGETAVDENLNLLEVNADTLKPLSLGQLKTIRVRLEGALKENATAVEEAEKKRNEALKEVGNILHPTVPVSDDEDNNRVERTWGNVTEKKKYSHVDLIVVSEGNWINFYSCLERMRNRAVIGNVIFGVSDDRWS